jgi:hypothetical protein
MPLVSAFAATCAHMHATVLWVSPLDKGVQHSPYLMGRHSHKNHSWRWC